MQKLPKTPEKSGQSPQNNRAQREKISRRAKENPRKEKQPELSLPRIERKAEQGQKQQQQKSFDDMLKQFMTESSSKMSSIKQYSEHKTKTRRR